MLSYQHAYHAGNPADVHKHALLAAMLAQLTAKDRPVSYLETHAGRAVYDLASPEARKTDEAAAGVGRLEGRFPADHPWRQALAAARAKYGAAAYPGSPLIAAYTLRPADDIHLAELHPQEHAALAAEMRGMAHVHRRDGWEMALALTPPRPPRGLMLIDPSWELKDDYARAPQVMAELARRWSPGVLVLWYPILEAAPHRPMLRALTARFPQAMRHEVAFPPVRPGHRMTGSGLFVVNPPYGTDAAAARVAAAFKDP
jgi:23S rRNA (adenine2030-N6)-methyltransferase